MCSARRVPIMRLLIDQDHDGKARVWWSIQEDWWLSAWMMPVDDIRRANDYRDVGPPPRNGLGEWLRMKAFISFPKPTSIVLSLSRASRPPSRLVRFFQWLDSSIETPPPPEFLSGAKQHMPQQWRMQSPVWPGSCKPTQEPTATSSTMAAHRQKWQSWWVLQGKTWSSSCCR